MVPREEMGRNGVPLRLTPQRREEVPVTRGERKNKIRKVNFTSWTSSRFKE